MSALRREIIRHRLATAVPITRRTIRKAADLRSGTIAGVKLKAQVKELLLRGRTEVIKGFIAKTGMMFDAPLKLTPEGPGDVRFSEKPKPVDTTLKCPKCGHFMKKSQWYYECECGFKVAHTVAKVELEEAVMQELLRPERRRKKITGLRQSGECV